jgi:transposase
MDTISPSDRGIRRLQTRQIGALPLVEPILAALAVRQTVNDLAPSEADVDLGQSVILLVLNRLLAPRPLDGIQDWLAGTVLPEVLGVRVAQAYDNRFGRALDHLHPQLGELWRRIVSRAIQVYDLDLTALHWDPTSIYFEGAYVASRLAAYGYSRDQRPDTKQINLEVDVTHEGAVPLLYQRARRRQSQRRCARPARSPRRVADSSWEQVTRSAMARPPKTCAPTSPRLTNMARGLLDRPYAPR